MKDGDARAVGLNVRGTCDPAFNRVREAFINNLQLGEDLGAYVAIYRHGRCIVDLTGGRTRSGDPYPHDALQLLYSVTKGVTTFCLMHLVDTGTLELDRHVAHYWPEFAHNGKHAVTVRQLLSHQSGLSGIAQPLSRMELGDQTRVAALLAAQAPLWPPGRAHGYHALTFGVLAGELVRRLSGRSIGAFLQDTLATQMELELFIGLPPHLHHRVVPQFDAPPNPVLSQALSDAAGQPGTLTQRAFSNPSIDTDMFNEPAMWTLELAGVNGIGTARSLAALYSVAVDGPLRRISSKTVENFRRECVFGPDLILIDQPTRFGAGFMLPSPREPMLSKTSFGHNGRGGALAFADPESGIAFAYIGNRLNHDPTPHSRLWRLLSAVREAL